MESTRKKENEVKKETTEQLSAFRRQQEDAEKAARSQGNDTAAPEVSESWTVGPRKRKKGKESIIGGVKVRRTSTAEKEHGAVPPGEPPTAPRKPSEPPSEPPTETKKGLTTKAESLAPATTTNTASTSTSPTPAVAGLGLAAYSSDEDE